MVGAKIVQDARMEYERPLKDAPFEPVPHPEPLSRTVSARSIGQLARVYVRVLAIVVFRLV
jgi:hypothetical protein